MKVTSRPVPAPADLSATPILTTFPGIVDAIRTHGIRADHLSAFVKACKAMKDDSGKAWHGKAIRSLVTNAIKLGKPDIAPTDLARFVDNAMGVKQSAADALKARMGG